MKMTIVNKKCESCSTDLIGVNHQTKYCDSCREKSNKNSTKKYKTRTRKVISENKEKQLVNNFKSIVKESYQLTPIGFDEVSEISYHSYKNLFRKTWVEIVKDFNRLDDLLGYIVKEYNNFIKHTGKQDIRSFADNHRYIGTQMLKTIGFDYIRELANVKKRRNTEEDCKNEFFRIISLYNRVPLYSEFMDNTKIAIKSFVYHLNITDTKNTYDSIVKYFVSEEMFNDYIINKLKHKTLVGRDNHQGYKHTNEELKDNLTNIFDKYYKEYNTYPSRHVFNKISNIDSSVYSHRFNVTWSKVCEDYGYEFERKLNKSENISLGVVSEILNEEYEPQKTFDWLIGFKGFPLFCDGYFPNHELIVEFDGDQHRYPNEWFGGLKTFNDTKTNDKYKDVLIPRNGLRLFRISSEEPFWDKEYIRNKLIKNGIISNDLNSAI
jgi:hypothetical protein